MSNSNIKPMREEFNIPGSISLTVELLKKYPNKYFIETGSFRGGGIRTAWEAGFSKIFSIERNQELLDPLLKRFINTPEVQLFLGDSSRILKYVLEYVKGPATIFLDAHRRMHEEVEIVPLLKEIEAIKNHHIKKHTILIDDIFFATRQTPDWIGVTLDNIIGKLKEIHPNYIIEYEDGRAVPKSILVARIENDTSL